VSSTDTVAISGVVDKVVTRGDEGVATVLTVKIGGGDQIVSLIGDVRGAQRGQILRAEGVWQENAAWGRQLRADRIVLLAPSTPAGLASFLASGVIKGVGDAIAARMVEHFGDGLADVLDSAPERLSEVSGIGKRTAERIAQAWSDEKGTRDILMFLHSRGVRPARAQRILEAYGEQAVSRLMSDPYLLARDVRGIGFQTADAFAENIGVASDAPIRRVAALNESLRMAAEDGHTALPRGQAVSRAAGLISTSPTLIAEVVDEAVAGERLVATNADGESYLQLPELAKAEQAIAASIRARCARSPSWPQRQVPADIAERIGVALAPSQLAAIIGLLGSRVTVITGGPGTGKTTLVRAILAVLDSEADLDLALCAPTGRAARRLTESTGRAASTIHRLIEADPNRGFGRHADRPIEADLVIVDEVSMVDTLLMHALLQAMPQDAALILVGDVEQLPPVGPGQPLADIIACGFVPVFRLSEIFRQAAESGIVRNAHAIIRGEMPAFKSAASPDCFGIRAIDAEDAIAKLIDLVCRRIPERFEFDPIADIQVLAPVNRGATGIQRLNDRLRAALNPRPSVTLERAGTVYATADKVMQIENDNTREVYNGDVGRIVAIDRQTRIVDVRFEDKTLLYGADDLDQLQPAYAVTVHKAQGSEYPAVVLLLMREHGRMLRRQLLYTAMTRARRLLVVIAQGDALERAVKSPLPPRRSLLIASLQASGSKQSHD